MTRSQIFTAAHKLAKTFTGKYSACLAEALRIVWAASKTTTIMEQNLKITLCIPFADTKSRNKAKSASFRWDAQNKVWTREFESVEAKNKFIKWASNNSNILDFQVEDKNQDNTETFGTYNWWAAGMNGE